MQLLGKGNAIQQFRVCLCGSVGGDVVNQCTARGGFDATRFFSISDECGDAAIDPRSVGGLYQMEPFGLA